MSDFQNQSWIRKFANAFRGIGVAMVTQQSFWVHVFAAVVVLAMSVALKVSWAEAMVLVGCVFFVFVAEMFNTSIEFLSRKVSRDESPEIRDALDVAAGGVLIASLGAATLGGLILLPKTFYWFFGAA